MLIRCTRCHALFSLQDGIAEKGPSLRVECGRCLLVFEAATPVLKPAGEGRVTPLQTRPVAQRKAESPGAAELRARSNELARALKPRRPGDKPEEGEFEAQLRRTQVQRRRLLLGAGALGLIAALVVGGLQLRRAFGGLSRGATERMERGRALVLHDDLHSLEQGAALFAEAARLAPGEAGPEAERAFALLLQAATHKDLADRLERLGREANDHVARLQMEKPDGYEQQISALAEQVAKIAQERDPHVRAATRLLQEGAPAAKAALDEDPEDPAALRAMALYCALTDAPDRGMRYLDQAEKIRPAQDPFIPWTRAALSLAGATSRDKQDRALAALASAQQAEPKLVRARVDTGAIALDRQQPGSAREAFVRALEQTPQHERASRLLALVPAAP